MNLQVFEEKVAFKDHIDLKGTVNGIDISNAAETFSMLKQELFEEMDKLVDVYIHQDNETSDVLDSVQGIS